VAVRSAAVLKAPRKARPISAGASTDVAAARRAALREALEQVVANVPGALAGRDPEYLHQLRVGTRRLRAALHAFRGTMRESDARALRRALRRLAAVAGPVRDLDVAAPQLPAELRAPAGRRRRAAHAALRRVLGAWQPWLLPRGRAAPRRPLPDFAREVLERLDRKALRRGGRIDWARPGKRHALRVRLRRLRYACEFFQGAFAPGAAERLIDSLKALQDLLGELNDYVVRRRIAREMGGRRAPVGARERVLLAQLPAAWRRFARAPRFWRTK
jgi:CHAD domain-containing protein